MGYMRHHAIIVTGFQEEAVSKAHTKAASLFADVSPIIPSKMNGYRTFLVPPDGSKEGWADSNEGDDRRKKFKTWLADCRGDNLFLDWVEVQYGDGEGETRIIADSDAAMRAE